MDIGSDEISEGFLAPRSGEYSSCDVPCAILEGSVDDNENLGNLLNYFESYLQDINGCLLT